MYADFVDLLYESRNDLIKANPDKRNIIGTWKQRKRIHKRFQLDMSPLTTL